MGKGGVPQGSVLGPVFLRSYSFYFIFLINSLVAVGGGEDLRRYWADYLKRTHVLVYVVDASDRSRLPLANAELHRLLGVEPQLPVVVLGNKQVGTGQQEKFPPLKTPQHKINNFSNKYSKIETLTQQTSKPFSNVFYTRGLR